jgi:hypothetical protein
MCALVCVLHQVLITVLNLNELSIFLNDWYELNPLVTLLRAPAQPHAYKVLFDEGNYSVREGVVAC